MMWIKQQDWLTNEISYVSENREFRIAKVFNSDICRQVYIVMKNGEPIGSEYLLKNAKALAMNS